MKCLSLEITRVLVAAAAALILWQPSAHAGRRAKELVEGMGSTRTFENMLDKAYDAIRANSKESNDLNVNRGNDGEW